MSQEKELDDHRKFMYYKEVVNPNLEDKSIFLFFYDKYENQHYQNNNKASQIPQQKGVEQFIKYPELKKYIYLYNDKKVEDEKHSLKLLSIHPNKITISKKLLQY